jgi:hypothetical protein
MSLLQDVEAALAEGGPEAAASAAADGAFRLACLRQWPALDAALARWPAGHPPAVLDAIVFVSGLSLARPHLPSRDAFLARVRASPP